MYKYKSSVEVVTVLPIFKWENCIMVNIDLTIYKCCQCLIVMN